MLEHNNYIEFDNIEVFNLFSKKPLDFRNDFENSMRLIPNNFDKIVIPNQNHTGNVRIYDGKNDLFEDTDGLITNIKGVGLATLVADCQSIILYDPVKQVIGNIHSGWKGTLNKIIKNAINLMIETYKCNPEDIQAYIFPSICKNCFEVEEDVKKLFVNKFNDIDSFIIKKNNKYYIDTIGINELMMKKMGIKQIVKSNICTKCNNNNYHSYRVDKEQSGRNISIIALKK